MASAIGSASPKPVLFIGCCEMRACMNAMHMSRHCQLSRWRRPEPGPADRDASSGTISVRLSAHGNLRPASAVSACSRQKKTSLWREGRNYREGESASRTLMRGWPPVCRSCGKLAGGLYEAEYFTDTPRWRKYACMSFLPERLFCASLAGSNTASFISSRFSAALRSAI